VTALATHPIQYQAPWFRALAAVPGIELHVLFEFLPDARAQGRGFDHAFQWDVPVLDGYRWRSLSASGTRRARLAGLRELHRTLRRDAPEVLLLTGWQSLALLIAPGIARRAGARCLVRGETSALRPRGALRHSVHRALLSRYDGFLAIGVQNRHFYASQGVRAERVFDCPYFVDNEHFDRLASRARARRAQLREQFGIPGEAVCFVYAGKLEPKKRVLDAVRAMAGLGDLPAHLLVVGSGPLHRSLRRHASGLPVSFAGFLNQSRIPEAYAAADCLVLASDHGETWGLVVNEAMASGLPAIVSDQVGCGADLVSAGSTGWTYPTGDVKALAAAMRHAVGTGRGLADMGAAARERVMQRYSVDAATRATVDAVRNVAARTDA
jgi:glycosyltransferase involved in cell wall biosynthesis